MMRHYSQWRIGFWASVLAALLTGLTAHALNRENGQQTGEDLRVLQGPRDIRDVPIADGGEREHQQNRPYSSPATILDDSRRPTIGLDVTPAGFSSPIVPPIVICAPGTVYEYQHNDDGQKQIATLGGGDEVHFAWTHADVIPAPGSQPNRFVNYNAYSTDFGLSIGNCGCTISNAGGDPILAHGGYSTIDVTQDNRACLAFHQRSEPNQNPPGPSSSYVLCSAIPAFCLFSDNEMAGSGIAESIWPHIQIDQAGGQAGADVYHVAALPTGDQPGFTDQIHYWRRVGMGVWEGPVVLDQAFTSINHHVAADPTSEQVAVVYQRDQDNPNGHVEVCYLESPTNGLDWIIAGAAIYPSPVAGMPGVSPRVYITNYPAPAGPQAWLEVCGEYDFDGVLHIAWIEQLVANVSQDCSINHWNDLSLTTTQVVGAVGWANTGDVGGRDLWLAYPQIGFGDGTTLCNGGPMNPGPAGNRSNRNYVYLSYNQYGGPGVVEQNDVSTAGFHNLEVYLTLSKDQGSTWCTPANLTDTKTPGCTSAPGNECASERNPSIAKLVNDTIHMFYVFDTDAGDAVFGQGSWTFNPVHYLRIPGGTDTCPLCDCQCSCPFQGDCDEDGFITALDLGKIIDVLFFGDFCPKDPCCPTERMDWDCDCFVTALDLSEMIDHLFFGGPPPCDPCSPLLVCP